MSMLYDDFAPNETTKKKDCPCCKCEAHWSACRFCDYYDTETQRNHERYHKQ